MKTKSCLLLWQLVCLDRCAFMRTKVRPRAPRNTTTPHDSHGGYEGKGPHRKGYLSINVHHGDNCKFTTEGKEASLSDFRPGQRVTVNYQDASGVLVADRIAKSISVTPARLPSWMRATAG